MRRLIKRLVYTFLLVFWTSRYALGKGCVTNDGVVKLHLNGTLKISIQCTHAINNVIVSRVRKSRTHEEESFSVNSNETPHFYDRSFENRTEIKRSLHGNALDISISKAVFADGGTFSVVVSADHEQIRSLYMVYIIGKPTTPFISLSGNSVEEGRYLRFKCASNPTTQPRNPDWPLQYMFHVNGVKIAKQTAGKRFMVSDNELLIAGISKRDAPLKITCVVRESGGFSTNVSANFGFLLPDSEVSKYKTGCPSDGTSKQGQTNGAQGTDSVLGWFHLAALTIVGTILVSLS